ncbi:MAG: HAMP domain-containing sensor histidine kinase [Myxococcales bacterium]
MAEPKGVADDFNVRIVLPLANYLKEHQGSTALASAASSAGLGAESFDGRSRWMTLEQTERFLQAARALLPSDEAFREACAYDYRNRSYGWMLAMGTALTTPWAAYVAGRKFINSSVTRYGRFEHSERVGGRCLLRYVSKGGESHLLCTVRASQISAVTTMFDLPPVRVEHPRCIARGDPCCEYVFQLVEPARWLPAAVGLVGGSLGLALLHALLGTAASQPAALLPVAGLLTGLGYEWRRAHRANQHAVLQSQESMLQLAQEDAEARRELMAFEQRQRDWVRLMEEQVAERLANRAKVVEELRLLEQHRVELTRGFTHDVNNALTVLRTSTDMLLDAPETRSPARARAQLELMASASDRMTKLVHRLMDAMGSESSKLQSTPRVLQVPELVERLRRRITALCYHRDIRTSVFSAREAPERIEIDELLFDRAVDNLFSNAAKYTEHGSIVVELSGLPGFLTVKVSDTGRGIAEADLPRIFLPAGSDASERARDSYGLGLSVVVQLLAEIGGRLEVMSKPGMGTTFWLHVPERPVNAAAMPTAAGEATSRVAKVVNIRRSPS